MTTTARTGFQRLFTDIGTGKVGILLITDASRLAMHTTVAAAQSVTCGTVMTPGHSGWRKKTAPEQGN